MAYSYNTVTTTMPSARKSISNQPTQFTHPSARSSMQDMSTSQSPAAKERNYKIIKTIGSLRSITESMGARRKQSKFETNIIYNEKSLNPVMEVP